MLSDQKLLAVHKNKEIPRFVVQFQLPQTCVIGFWHEAFKPSFCDDTYCSGFS